MTMDCRARWGLFADVFAYPTARYLDSVRALAGAFPAQAAPLAELDAALSPLGPTALEELYVRTFDVSAACVPYLSVHVFGEESFKRAELMTGLAAAYAREELHPGRELPDHISVVLRLGPALPEWHELVRACVLGAVAAMRAEAEGAKSPHRHALDALLGALAAEVCLTPAEERALARVAPREAPRADGRKSPGRVLADGPSCGPRLDLEDARD